MTQKEFDEHGFYKHEKFKVDGFYEYFVCVGVDFEKSIIYFYYHTNPEVKNSFEAEVCTPIKP